MDKQLILNQIDNNITLAKSAPLIIKSIICPQICFFNIKKCVSLREYL